MKKITMGLDPGSSICGVCFLDEEYQIIEALNLGKDDLWDKIKEYYVKYNLIAIIEDIKPYTLRLTPQVIDTCKLIGELTYRLKNQKGIKTVLVSRNEVKKWIFDTFPEVCEPLIRGKIDKKMFLSCRLSDRELEWVDAYGRNNRRKQSFIFVDDRVVVESMKKLYNIPFPPPGSGYKHGLKEHSWQALAAASWFIHSVLK